MGGSTTPCLSHGIELDTACLRPAPPLAHGVNTVLDHKCKYNARVAECYTARATVAECYSGQLLQLPSATAAECHSSRVLQYSATVRARARLRV